MADDADREATKLRLLAMAVDYEERAKVADDLVESNTVDEDIPELDVAEMDGVVGVQSSPNAGKSSRVKLDRNNVRGLKETIVVERLPTFRR